MNKIKAVILPLLFIACQQQFPLEPKLIDALTDESITIRGNLIEIDQQTYRLDYYDGDEPDSHYEQLASKGYQGGGPTWLGITYGAIKLSDPNLLDDIRFDDEADGLAIWSSNKSTLEQIGRLLSTIKSDERLLNDCIKVAEANWTME
jgi:hypothetical protein